MEQEIKEYIRKFWETHRRDCRDIECITEKKFEGFGNLYIPFTENLEVIKSQTSANVYQLPKDFKSVYNDVLPGLLYLPKPYIVPGGRFNEMYGWDSYFINLGLLQDGLYEYAKDNIENLLYQIKHYGKILNGNRSYYLERSNPPLISKMVLEYFFATGENKAWLRSVVDTIEEHFVFWRSGDKYVEKYNLSRYYAENDTPSYEVLNSHGETEANYFDSVEEYFISNPNKRFYNSETNTLTPEFFRADRTMRESGFDITEQFGVFCEYINDYLPVCLNSLLYAMAEDLADIYNILGNDKKAAKYSETADSIYDSINKYLWSDELGRYTNYNIVEEKNSEYIFVTSFYPLWAGLADEEKSKKMVNSVLPILEGEYGLSCSNKVTNKQWDRPYCWAPLMFFAVLGLQNYGFDEDAERLANKWVTKVNNHFKNTGNVKEKYYFYDKDEKGEVPIEYGYTTNETGFGWTNGVYLYFINEVL